MTGQRRNAHRYMMVMTFEVRRHTLLVTLLGALASFPVAMLCTAIFGPPGFVVIVLGIPLTHLLFGARQRKGLRVYRYTSMLNSRKAVRGFWINGQPFATPMFIMHQPTVVDVAESNLEHGTALVRGKRDRTYQRNTLGAQARA
ncbi:hypothetical protein ACXR2T_10265 [Leucobacter sp. HY1910]